MQQDGTIVWQPTLIIGYFDLAWASFRAVKCLCSKVQATWKLKENVIEFFEHGAFTIALIHNNTENGTTTIFAKELILQAQQHAVQRVVIPSALHHKNIIGSQKYIYESVASGTGLNLVGAKVLDGSLVVKDAQLNALVHMCKMVSLPLTLIIVAGTRYLKTDSDGTREATVLLLEHATQVLNISQDKAAWNSQIAAFKTGVKQQQASSDNSHLYM